jgi:hypothetical protein
MKKFEFTVEQVALLVKMCSEVAEHDDIMRQTFPNARQRQAADDAYETLRAALRRPRARTQSEAKDG